MILSLKGFLSSSDGSGLAQEGSCGADFTVQIGDTFWRGKKGLTCLFLKLFLFFLIFFFW